MRLKNKILCIPAFLPVFSTQDPKDGGNQDSSILPTSVILAIKQKKYVIWHNFG